MENEKAILYVLGGRVWGWVIWKLEKGLDKEKKVLDGTCFRQILVYAQSNTNV